MAVDRNLARTLSSAQVDVAPDTEALRPTTYRSDRLLIPVGPGGDAVREVLEGVASSRGLSLRVDERHRRLLAELRPDEVGLVRATPVFFTDGGTASAGGAADDRSVDDRSLDDRSLDDRSLDDRALDDRALDDRAAEPPDAWSLARSTRRRCRRRREQEAVDVADVHLDHLMLGTDPDVAGLPARASRIHGNGLHIGGYGVEGGGIGATGIHIGGYPSTPDRIPVTWVGDAPARTPVLGSGRRPVVAVLDTGCTQDHPWFAAVDGADPADEVVVRDVRLGAVSAGLTDPATDPEVRGDLTGPLDALLDSHAGHGTFISGLLLQSCPDAQVLAVRVMSAEGVVVESDLLHALTVLAVLVSRYRANPAEGQAVDAVVLSLGYHHERPVDSLLDVPLLEVITKLRRLGVTVVASAGNDASDQPLFPAAFARYPDAGTNEDRSMAPMVSVGSTNPDNSMSLFSNSGDWVTDWRPGASVVSTMPCGFAGGLQPTVSFVDRDGFVRSTADPDDFTTGFGVWSGTSFAGPTLAGALLRHLLTDARTEPTSTAGLLDTPDGDDALSAAARARAALEAVRTQAAPRRRTTR